jgi:hypothetical protein
MLISRELIQESEGDFAKAKRFASYGHCCAPWRIRTTKTNSPRTV